MENEPAGESESSVPNETSAVDEANDLINQIYDLSVQLVPRWRRIVRALHGLGLLDIVGSDWLQISNEGIEVGALTPAVADRLATALENIESAYKPPVAPRPVNMKPLFVLPVDLNRSAAIGTRLTRHAGGIR
jgi:hypothetical protein